MNTSAALLCTLLMTSVPAPDSRAEQRERVELVVRGVVPLSPLDAHAIVLMTKDQQLVVPLVVDEGTAAATVFRLARRPAPVPFSQELSSALVERLGAEVTEVWIDGVRQTEAKGRVLVRQGDHNLSFAALPGDAVVLALSQHVRIFASRALVDKAGVPKRVLESAIRDSHRKRQHTESPDPLASPNAWSL